MLLFSFCDCHWIIPWILAALLGALLCWLLHASIRRRVKELEEENERLRGMISNLEGQLSDCKAKRAALDSELTLLKGTIKEKEAELAASRMDSKGKEGSSEDVGTKSTAKESGIKSGDVKGPASTGTTPLAAAGIAAGTAQAGGKNIYSVLTDDNLQVVEGIGPKMDEVLKKGGVKNWSDLAASTNVSLRSLLDEANAARYRIIDPATWPKQAAMAASGDWESLISYQKKLDTGRTSKSAGTTDSKVEKILIKMGALKRWKQDDLKAVEGIGPKIEGLLKTKGIDTWRKLSTASEDTIKKILEEAGPRFRLADPASWPKQAEMAADGRWDDLDEYQAFLQGGK